MPLLSASARSTRLVERKHYARCSDHIEIVSYAPDTHRRAADTKVNGKQWKTHNVDCIHAIISEWIVGDVCSRLELVRQRVLACFVCPCCTRLELGTPHGLDSRGEVEGSNPDCVLFDGGCDWRWFVGGSLVDFKRAVQFQLGFSFENSRNVPSELQSDRSLFVSLSLCWLPVQS